MRSRPGARLGRFGRFSRYVRFAAGVLLASGGVLAGPALAAPPMPWGPYQHVPLGMDPARPLIESLPWSAVAPVTVWAFATGHCDAEAWGEFDTDHFVRLNVAAFEQAGRDFIVSTGGEAAGFDCPAADAETARRWLARYASKRLVGLDFDIERGQSPAQIAALVRLGQLVAQQAPSLRVSYTVATHASADGTRRSLNATGEQVLQALKAAGFERAILNLMVMNYGPPDARWCVPDAAGRACDMGRSAVQAAHNVHQRYGLAWSRIALTAMLGENDVAGNVFTPDDASHLAREARRLGLAGVHWWSAHRDQPCAAGSPRVSPLCHALPGVAAGSFVQRFGAGLR